MAKGQVDLGLVVGRDGVGVVEGGTTGQALVKKTNSDYVTEWKSVNTLVDGKNTYVDSSLPAKQTIADKLSELSVIITNEDIDQLFA